jgi:hydroxyacylglutathione hydrolase
MSTLGYERIANPYLDRGLGEDAFVERTLANLPPRPEYYLRMKELNSRGPASLGQLSAGPSIPPEDARDLQEEGHLILDIRNQTDFGRGHIPGSMCIGCGQHFSTWAGWMVPPGTPLILAGPNSRVIENAVRGLVRIGLDQIAGHITGGVRAWDEAGLPLARHEVIPSQELQERLAAGEDLEILDVRSDREWNEGHIENATHIPLQELPSRIDSIAGSTCPIVTICGGGYRSAIAASLLQQAGEAEVIDQLGGMAAWQREGCSTTTRSTEASTRTD